MVAERREGANVGWHGVTGEEASHHAAQPLALFSDALVPAPPKVFSDFQQLRHLPVTPCVARQQEATPPRPRADMSEAEKVEGLWLAIPACRPIGRGTSAEFDQPGLVGMRLQVEFRHPDAQVRQKPFGISSMLKANDGVVSISHHDHGAVRMASPPLPGPQIVDVMKVDVRQQ
jgi:hypothetical protein